MGRLCPALLLLLACLAAVPSEIAGLGIGLQCQNATRSTFPFVSSCHWT